jgi:hypothetical protein
VDYDISPLMTAKFSNCKDQALKFEKLTQIKKFNWCGITKLFIFCQATDLFYELYI